MFCNNCFISSIKLSESKCRRKTAIFVSGGFVSQNSQNSFLEKRERIQKSIKLVVHNVIVNSFVQMLLRQQNYKIAKLLAFKNRKPQVNYLFAANRATALRQPSPALEAPHAATHAHRAKTPTHARAQLSFPALASPPHSTHQLLALGTSAAQCAGAAWRRNTAITAVFGLRCASAHAVPVDWRSRRATRGRQRRRARRDAPGQKGSRAAFARAASQSAQTRAESPALHSTTLVIQFHTSLNNFLQINQQNQFSNQPGFCASAAPTARSVSPNLALLGSEAATPSCAARAAAALFSSACTAPCLIWFLSESMWESRRVCVCMVDVCVCVCAQFSQLRNYQFGTCGVWRSMFRLPQHSALRKIKNTQKK